MNKRELIKNVQLLADKWGLNDSKKQELKIFEEFGELCKAELENDIDEIKDGVGDVLITILVYDYILDIEELTNLTNVTNHINELGTYSIYAQFYNEDLEIQEYVFTTISDIIKKHKIDPWECLQTEYNKVSKRK